MTLTLIRHAQASFLSGDYDRLSQLGEEQSRLLGEHLAGEIVSFDAVFCGPRKRHRATERIIRETFERCGRPWPQAQFLEELDEYHAEEAMRQFVPLVAQSDARMREIVEAYQRCREIEEKRRLFQRMFEPITRMWVDGELDSPQVERWTKFEERIHAALERIVEVAEKGGRVAAITSAGPIAVAVQKALGASSMKTLELSWVLRNCSLAEFFSSQGRFSLSSFNVHPHLSPKHLTYR